jgi:hypothetical protein
MILNYAEITLLSLYAFGSARRVYKKHLRGLRFSYKAPILISMFFSLALLILIIDAFLSELLGFKSCTLFSAFQYNYLLPVCISVLPGFAYFLVIVVFYVISVTVVDKTVYESVEYYLKNYESHPEKITYMCFNILTQGLLLSIGYFSLFITLIKLTTWRAFEWDDQGFLLVISSILAAAMKFPKRNAAKWNDSLLNSYAVFLSIKSLIITGKYIVGSRD